MEQQWEVASAGLLIDLLIVGSSTGPLIGP
jgi:hypothetical protein